MNQANTMREPATFSPDRLYRYTLWREWSVDSLTGCADDLPNIHRYLMVIGLNPSTADETKDDPTIRKCIGFAKRWGFGALCMTNLFAWRDTDPVKMKKVAEPIGPENDRVLSEIAIGAGMKLAAWGKHGSHKGRAHKALNFLSGLHALKLNGDGSPMHPLYVPYETVPVVFPPRA